MWDQQREFMDLLVEERSFVNYPVDLKTKNGQKLLKQLTHECQHELFEANQHLKNSKNHRITDTGALDKAEYVEEIADAMHYMLEILIYSGVSIDEFYDIYMSKGELNKTRIKDGY